MRRQHCLVMLAGLEEPRDLSTCSAFENPGGLIRHRDLLLGT
jgi:hypothetical protein